MAMCNFFFNECKRVLDIKLTDLCAIDSGLLEILKDFARDYDSRVVHAFFVGTGCDERELRLIGFTEIESHHAGFKQRSRFRSRLCCGFLGRPGIHSSTNS